MSSSTARTTCSSDFFVCVVYSCRKNGQRLGIPILYGRVDSNVLRTAVRLGLSLPVAVCLTHITVSLLSLGARACDSTVGVPSGSLYLLYPGSRRPDHPPTRDG